MEEKLFRREQFQESAQFILQRTALRPRIALTLGSGLSPLADALTDVVRIPYAEIPHFPCSTVAGHEGKLLVGRLNGQPIITLQGRVHYYEGYNFQEVTYYVRVLREMGVETLILTNAAGGLNPSLQTGDLMLIEDHIFFPGLAGNTPLRGPNDEKLGPRFLPMTRAYDAALLQLAQRVGKQMDIPLRKGIYVSIGGPSFETPAEVRFLRLLADAVGMSTAPETIVAQHGGMRVLGLSTITNQAIDSVNISVLPTHEEVLEAGQAVAPRLIILLKGIINAWIQS